MLDMAWSFWKRNSNDPLVKLFFDKYGFNLLSIPREKVQIGDIYIKDQDSSGPLSNAGNISNFLTPEFKVPDAIYDETMADVSGTISSDISANAGLQFLESFLNALGGGAFGTQIKGKF